MNTCEGHLAEKRARGAKLIESNTKLELCVGAGQRIKKERDDERAWTIVKMTGAFLGGLLAGYAVGKLTGN